MHPRGKTPISSGGLRCQQVDSLSMGAPMTGRCLPEQRTPPAKGAQGAYRVLSFGGGVIQGNVPQNKIFLTTTTKTYSTSCKEEDADHDHRTGSIKSLL